MIEVDPILLVSAILAYCGYHFKNSWSKGLFWFAAFVLFVPGLAWTIYSLIDLSQCNGNFLKGMFCPEPFKSSTTYKVAEKAFLWGFLGMWPAIFVSVPVVVVAIGIEWHADEASR